MQTRRDRALLILLCTNAGLGFIGSSAYTAQLLPLWGIALVGLVSGTLSTVTATYVAFTREYERVPIGGITSPPK